MSLLKRILGMDRKKGMENYRKGIRDFNRLRYEAAIKKFEAVLKEKSLANSLEANLAQFYCGRAYINVGITKFAKNNNQAALDFFQRALSFNSDDTDLHYFIGICLNNLGDFQGAMESFSKILETEPWNIPTKLKIAIIFHNMKMWENAEEIHRAILAKHPEFADVHYHLGLSLMSQNKPDEAAESLSRALSINPKYTEARLKLAIVQICTNHLGKAENNLRHAVKLHPGYADIYYLLAIVMEKKGCHHDAVTLLKSALDISPKFKNALVKLIISLCRTGEKNAAEAVAAKALGLYPEDIRFGAIQKALRMFDPEFDRSDKAKNRIIDLEEENLIKELKHEFHKDLDIMPNVSEIISMFNNSRYTQKDRGITEFLIPFITEQINRNPTYPDLYNSLGTQLLSAKKTIEAETAFSKALELNPDYIAARVNIMKTLFKNGNLEQALLHGEYLVPKNLHFPDVYFTLAQIQVELENYDQALVNAKRVLKLRPGMNNARLLLAKIYLGRNETEAAYKMLETFLEGPTDPVMEEEAQNLMAKLKPSGDGLF